MENGLSRALFDLRPAMSSVVLAALLSLPGANTPGMCKPYSRLVTAECVLAGVPVRQVWFRWPNGHQYPGHAVTIVNNELVIDNYGVRGRTRPGLSDEQTLRRIWPRYAGEW